MNATSLRPDFLDLAAQIVSAYLANNSVREDALPDFIQSIYAALNTAGSESAAEKLNPAVPVKTSVFHDYIICLEDGKKLQMLKRHLGMCHGITPEEYRQRWNLPDSYPMIAPNYARKRSFIAKQTGLGRKTTSPVEPPAPPVLHVPEGVSGSRVRGKEKAA